MLSEELMYRRRILMSGEKEEVDPSILYEAYNLSFNGSNYIDTGVYLFTQENINKDFEFIAEGIVGPNGGNNTIICAKHNANSYGFLVRTSNSTNTSYKGTISTLASPNICEVIVRRVNGAITLSGTNIKNPSVEFTNSVFNWPLVLGCAVDDNGNLYRYATGTIEHVKFRWL